MGLLYWILKPVNEMIWNFLLSSNLSHDRNNSDYDYTFQRQVIARHNFGCANLQINWWMGINTGRTFFTMHTMALHIEFTWFLFPHGSGTAVGD